MEHSERYNLYRYCLKEKYYAKIKNLLSFERLRNRHTRQVLLGFESYKVLVL